MNVTIAHSPDADDAFMFWALAAGKIPTPGYAVTHVLKDIETLNRCAAQGVYEVTALSFHAYAFVNETYDLMTCGASVGDGYGPVVVSREPMAPGGLGEATVAVPGIQTTAALALRLAFPKIRCEAVPFDKIGLAILSGRFTAGVLIHEGQLTFAGEGLHKVIDLGAWWKEETGLPLPLGGNGILRRLPANDKRALEHLVHASIAYGLAHREEALAHALRYGRGLDTAKGDRFVGMYVNDFTLDLGEAGKKAVAELFSRAYERRLIPSQVPLCFVSQHRP